MNSSQYAALPVLSHHHELKQQLLKALHGVETDMINVSITITLVQFGMMPFIARMAFAAAEALIEESKAYKTLLDIIVIKQKAIA